MHIARLFSGMMFGACACWALAFGIFAHLQGDSAAPWWQVAATMGVWGQLVDTQIAAHQKR